MRHDQAFNIHVHQHTLGGYKHCSQISSILGLSKLNKKWSKD